RSIREYNPKIEVLTSPSQNLATLIESAAFDEKKIKAEIKSCFEGFCEAGLEDIIWGCTHYPLAEGCFRELYPWVNFINPAQAEALAVKDALGSLKLLNNQEKRGDFLYCTSGYGELALKTMERLEITPPQIIKERQIL
ncbi:MAG: hypothetical protein RRY40_04935, partial [Oscillospiraceae bacterium]